MCAFASTEVAAAAATRVDEQSGRRCETIVRFGGGGRLARQVGQRLALANTISQCCERQDEKEEKEEEEDNKGWRGYTSEQVFLTEL